jgi:hypothetical protein
LLLWRSGQAATPILEESGQYNTYTINHDHALCQYIMKYVEYTCYYIIYLGRTGRNKSIYEYFGTSEKEEEFPGYPMEKPRWELQEYPMYYH